MTSGECAITIPFETIRSEVADMVRGELPWGWHLDWVTTTLYPGVLGDSSDDVIKLAFRVYVTDPGMHAEVSIYLQLLEDAPENAEAYFCDGHPARHEYPAVIVTRVSCSDDQPDWNYYAPCNYLARNGFNRCGLQEEIRDLLAPVLDQELVNAGIEIGGCELSCSYFTRDIFSMSGGFKLNDEDIHMLIPTVDGCAGDPACRVRATCIADEPENEVCALLFPEPVTHRVATIRPAQDLVDFPRWLKDELDVSEALGDNLLGAHVRCDHGFGDCAALGGDRDKDGLCDDIDYCPDLFTGGNFDHDQDGVGDGMGSFCTQTSYLLQILGGLQVTVPGNSGPLRTCRRECDNCSDEYNPGQQNTDRHFWFVPGNELGDVCDPDIDGDGIPNDLDCQPYHYSLRWDLDDDGRCDHLGGTNTDAATARSPGMVNACRQHCWQLIAYHGPGGPVDSSCYEQCEVDNCSPFMYWGPAYWDAEGTWVNPHADDPWCGALWSHPGGSREACSRQYANPDQADSDGNGIGDKCEFGAKSLSLEPSDSVWLEGGTRDWDIRCRRLGEHANIDFRTWGGMAPLPPSSTYEPELRTGVELGACKCNVGSGEGTMDNFVCRFFTCPTNSDSAWLEDYAWNPIAAPEISRTHLVWVPPWGPAIQVPDYPVHPQLAVDHPTRDEAVKSLGIVYARQFSFTRDSSENLHSFTWDYQATPRFDQWSQTIDYSANAIPGQYFKTQVRVAWPNYEDREDKIFESAGTNVLFSEERALWEHSACSGRSDIRARHLFVPVWDTVTRRITRKLPADRVWNALAEPAAGRILALDFQTGELAVQRLAYPSYQLVTEASLTFETQALDTSQPMVAVKGDVDQALLGGQAGPAPTLFFYELSGMTTHQTSDDLLPAPIGSARLLIGTSAPSSSEVTVRDAAAIFGGAAPTLQEAQGIFIETRQELVLLGRGSDPTGAWAHVAWKLALESGAWQGPFALALPATLTGQSVQYDPISRRILVFGGQVLGTPLVTDDPEPVVLKQSTLYEVDPHSFALQERATQGASAELGRSQAGTFLDTFERKLYVAGGLGQGDALLGDLWQLDLYTGQWTQLSLDAGQGPDGVARPLVFPDPVTGVVWLADLAQKSTEDPLPLWGLGRDAAWIAAKIGKPTTPVWPLWDAYVSGRPNDYSWRASPDEPWPGQLLVAELGSEEPVLGLSIRTGFGQALSAGVTDETGSVRAGALCPSGSTCQVSVRPLLGAALRDGLPFTLSAWPALLGEEQEIPLHRSISAMAIVGSYLALASGDDLHIFGAWDPPEHLSELTRPCGELITGLAPCGTGLCVSCHRRDAGLLAVVDLSSPSQPVALGRTNTKGHAVDIAARGLTAYLAEENRGLGIYDVSRPEAPFEVDRLEIGGKVVAVAAQGNLLVVAGKQRQLLFFDVSEGVVPLAERATVRKVSRLRLQGSKLWALDEQESSVEVFDLVSPAQPVSLGVSQGSLGPSFFRRFAGDMAFTFQKKKLKAARLLAVQ